MVCKRFVGIVAFKSTIVRVCRKSKTFSEYRISIDSAYLKNISELST
jgi:hypothetical protein